MVTHVRNNQPPCYARHSLRPEKDIPSDTPDSVCEKDLYAVPLTSLGIEEETETVEQEISLEALHDARRDRTK